MAKISRKCALAWNRVGAEWLLKLNMWTTYFEWELWEYYPELNIWMTYLSGSYVNVILVLYVADIFEWEHDDILIYG